MINRMQILTFDTVSDLRCSGENQETVIKSKAPPKCSFPPTDFLLCRPVCRTPLPKVGHFYFFVFLFWCIHKNPTTKHLSTLSTWESDALDKCHGAVCWLLCAHPVGAAEMIREHVENTAAVFPLVADHTAAAWAVSQRWLSMNPPTVELPLSQ